MKISTKFYEFGVQPLPSGDIKTWFKSKPGFKDLDDKWLQKLEEDKNWADSYYWSMVDKIVERKYGKRNE